MRTSSYENQKFRSRSMEKQVGMGFFPEDGDRLIDRWMDGWMDGWIDGWMYIYR
jgi:hypothetical protein